LKREGVQSSHFTASRTFWNCKWRREGWEKGWGLCCRCSRNCAYPQKLRVIKGRFVNPIRVCA